MLAEMGATVALSRDLRLVRRSIEVLLQSADPESGWPPPRAPAAKLPLLVDYPLLTAVAAAWLLRLTGDVPFARRVWPAVRRLAQALAACRGAEGLYVPPAMAFIDHGRRLTAGPTVAFNALAVAAWRAFAAIARAAEAADEAPAFEAHAAALETQLPGAYWDELAGTFRDLPLNGVARETEGSPAIVWPLLFAPATRVLAERVLPALRGMLEAFVPEHEAESVSPYQMFYLLALLRQLGEAELAEATIRRVYARMLASPTGTLWENALPDKSLNHAWSCGVNDYLATAVLGVRLGFDDAGESAAIRIAPCAATLTWARGRVPHPRGEVAVAWERRGDRLRVEVTAPPGVPVAVTPGGPLAALAADVTIG